MGYPTRQEHQQYGRFRRHAGLHHLPATVVTVDHPFEPFDALFGRAALIAPPEDLDTILTIRTEEPQPDLRERP